MKLRKEALVCLFSAGMLILQGCGNNNPQLKVLLSDPTTGSNTNGINEIDISTDPSKQTCSVAVQGERDAKYPNWAVVHTKLILNRDKIQWLAKDPTSTSYNIVFTNGSPISATINPINSGSSPVSIDASEATCIFGCEDSYDIQVADQNGNLHSCLPQQNGQR